MLPRSSYLPRFVRFVPTIHEVARQRTSTARGENIIKMAGRTGAALNAPLMHFGDEGSRECEEGSPANFRGLVLGCMKPIFESKYAFESSRRDLHNALLCIV